MIPGITAGGIVAGPDYAPARSMRSRGVTNSVFSRTPGTSGNRRVLCFRIRIKRGRVGSLQVIIQAGSTNIDRFYFTDTNQLALDVAGVQRLVTTATFQGLSSWYVDIGFELDVTAANAADRARILVDGAEVAYTTDTRSGIANADTNWNTAGIQHTLFGSLALTNLLQGHFADVALVDGSRTIDYSAAGSPVRRLRRPSATWGTNGFWLNFASGAIAANLGADASGNGNNWSPGGGFSITPGQTFDWSFDTPANNCSLVNIYDQFGSATPLVTDAFMTWETTTPSGSALTNGMRMTTRNVWATGGKYYAEFYVLTTAISNTGYLFIGAGSSYTWSTTTVNQIVGTNTTTIPILQAGDVVMLAIDADLGRIWWGRNGTWANTGTGTPDPAAGTGAAATFAPGVAGAPAIALDGRSGNIGAVQRVSFNGGQQPYTYTPPAGFGAIAAGRVPAQTPIASGSFTGNANANGPFIWLAGTPDVMTINGNPVTWGTHAIRYAAGVKIITALAAYNASGANTFSVSSFVDNFTAPNREKLT